MNINHQLAITRARMVAKRSLERAAAILAAAGVALQEALAWVRIWRQVYRLQPVAPGAALWTVPGRLYVGDRRVA